jgi:hypothetical protein
MQPSSTPDNLNWFGKIRQDWIAQMLRVYGFVNRFHLMRQFEISSAQAALDIKRFNETNAGAMTYDASRKTYVATPQTKRNEHGSQ